MKNTNALGEHPRQIDEEKVILQDEIWVEGGNILTIEVPTTYQLNGGPTKPLPSGTFRYTIEFFPDA